MYELFDRAIGEAMYKYDQYVKQAKANGEEVLTIKELIFGKRK